MFRTVFFAVLLALLVFNIFKYPELLIVIRKIIKPILIVGAILLLILIGYILIDTHSEDVEEILIVIGGLIVIGLIYAGFVYMFKWIKFQRRKKLGLIKEGVKVSDFFDEKFEKEWYDKLSKKQKEVEDKRAEKGPKIMFFCLIAIPILLLLAMIISLFVA